MEKSKILYVTQEIDPFLIESEISSLVRKVAQGVHEADKEIRIFMPSLVLSMKEGTSFTK